MYDGATVILSVSPEDTRPGRLFVKTVRDSVFVLIEALQGFIGGDKTFKIYFGLQIRNSLTED